MKLNVAVQMDPIERINIRGDSTFALLLEAQKRGHALSFYTPDKISLRGEEVVALPSGRSSRVKSIETFDGQLSEAFAGQAVAITLADEIDLGRGDMLVRSRNLPQGDEGDEVFMQRIRKGAVRDGRVYMPPFEGTLSQEAMWAIRTWLETVHED